VWHKLAAKRARFVRPTGPWFCQVYQVRARLWRWEVLHWNKRIGRFDLKRLGTKSALSQAIDAAQRYVEKSLPG
jgi:hypothetical protein